MISSQHMGLISRIYDLPLQPDKWSDVLDEFAPIMNAFGSTLVVLDPIYAELQVQAFSTVYQTMKNSNGVLLVDEYNTDFAKHDQPSVSKLLSSPNREFYSEFELSGIASMDEYLKHPPVRWNREHLGITHRAISRLNVHGVWSDAISVQFPSNRGEITEDEKETSLFFLDHFAKAIELGRSFGVLKSRFNGVFTALDRFHIGIFVLSPNGSVVVKNAEANRILDADDGLSLSRDGRLHPAGDNERGEIKDIITKAISTAQAGGNMAEQLMVLPKTSGSDSYLVEVAPIRDHGEIESDFKGCIVFVIDPAKTDVVSTEGMAMLYQLTGAESEICKLIAQGMETSDMAEARSNTTETVRSHIKKILQKTGVNNRSQLVRLALSVNLPIDQASKEE